MTMFCKPVITRFFSSLPGCLFLCLAGLGATGVAQVTRIGQGVITTVAGIQGQTGDSASALPTQAIQTSIGNPAAMVTDSSGNIYFTDLSASSSVWLLYVAGDAPRVLTNLYQPPFHTGYAYAIAGTIDEACAGGACGDNGLATQALLNGPSGLALDTSDNLYIADPGDNAIRKVTAATGIMSTIAGDPNHTMYGYSGENVPALGTYLFGPTSVAFDIAGNLYVADANNAIIRKINMSGVISTVAGTVPADGNPVFCATAPCGDGDAATSAQLGYVYNVFVDPATGDIYATDNGSSAIRKIDAQSGTIHTVAGTLLQTCTPGTPPTCGDGHAATMGMLNYPTASYFDSQGNLYIADTGDNGVRVVDTSGNIHTVVGQLSGAGAYDGGAPGTAADDAMLSGPFGIAFGLNGVLYVSDSGNNILRQVVPPSALASQTLTFPTPAPATYGQGPINLSGDATSTTSTGASTGLSATYSVISGPGTISASTLTITGAGTIVVQASQAGNSTYAPATPVNANIVVAPVTLTVTAPQNLPLKEGNAIPTLSASITGLVNNDQPSVVTGSPLLQVMNAGMILPPGDIPAPGSYPITVGAGTLAAANYIFTYVNGELIVSQGLVQTLAFSSYTPPTVYGGANSTFTFSVTSTSGLTPTVTRSGPAQLQNLSPTTWSMTVTGVGTVTLTATQTGNLTYAPAATATSQFVVGPAILTVPLTNATRQFGAPNPAFLYGTPTGFLGADNSSVLSGVPSYATASATSDPGTYPLTATQGTLFAQNYSFVFVPATLTITQATQQITNFTAPANVAYGGSGYALQAIASSNLPIVYSATGAVQIASTGTSFQATGVGPATITATQAGNVDYAPVSATVSFNVAQITQYVSAVAVSVPFDAALPQLNWCFARVDATTGLAACDSSITLPANLYSGTPAVTTAASEGSTPGTYPIQVSAGTLTSSVYGFVFAPGVLTITPAATYTLSANPSSITLSRGQSGQSMITLTPIHNYVGTVTIACSGLPAGVTCKVDPAGLTTSLNSQGVASPVSAMLTISAGQVVAQNAMGGSSRLLAAGMFGVPGLFAGILIFYRRAQFNQRSIFTGILLLVALGASTTFVTACGGGSSHSGEAQPGTTQIMITGSGAASAGAVSQSVGLTVTIQ